jgi:pimeloyl-ACP methyl ester carboxylesterase
MLHYTTYTHTPEAPWVTFVHGAGGSSSIWYKQIKDFRKEFNVLLIDLRGHGKSKKLKPFPFARYSFEMLGNEVIEVLDHLKIKTSHFVGISLGTIIIRELAERFPERISSMIMGGAVMKLNVRGQVLMRLGDLLKGVLPYLILYRLFAWVIMPRKTHRESRNLFINEAKKLYQKEFKKWFALTAQVNSLLKWFRIQESKVPALYIMGEEDHMFLPSISRLVRDHHNAFLYVIPKCGHVVNVDQPKVFNHQAIAFIQQNTGR